MSRIGKKKKVITGLSLATLVLTSGTVFAFASDPFGTSLVGRQTNGSVLTASNQLITPGGQQVEFNGNPLSSAIRPDGKTAVVLTRSGLNVLNLETGKITTTFNTNVNQMWGVKYSSDGSELYATGSQGGVGQIVRMSVASDGSLAVKARISLPAANVGGPINPQDIAVRPDGKTLLVALNRDNSMGVVNLETNQLASTIPVGNAPTSVVINGNSAYVSNVGGRRAVPGDDTNNSSGTEMVADPQTGGASTGTVSVIDLSTSTVTKTIPVGLQPTRMTVSGNHVFVANANSDTVSVIDTQSNNVVQTIDVKPYPGAPRGSQPNAVAMINDHQLVVSLGRDNALAMYDWSGPDQEPRPLGLVPTAWYPVDIAVDQTHNRLLVTNADGVGDLAGMGSVGYQTGTTRTGHQVYQQEGSASLIPFPAEKDLAHYTDKVYSDNNWFGMDKRNAQARRNVSPVAMPERIGEPSTIKHVFYIIKENRTYDQVLGDLGRGNGDPSLTQFGQKVTPNLHQLANSFPLLDNFYTSSIQSASGHQWVTQATDPDYQEKETDEGNVRSYPFNGGDALTYSSTGFLWNDAEKNGVSFANFGEYTNQFSGAGSYGTWTDWYNDYLKLSGQEQGSPHAAVGTFQATSDVPSLNSYTYHPFPGFDTGIPDQYRTQLFLNQFQGYVKNRNLPQLVTMTLPDDHTSGLASGLPTPQAAVADNDLAVGKIVDAISHSPYWKDSVIFITEDDSQNGVDHVDGHREPVSVISPWVKRGVVDSHYFTILNMDRSIEQILGLPPMNQNDAAAIPMSEIFTDNPDFTPYQVLANNVPLDTLNGQPGSDSYALSGTAQATPATQELAKEWTDWSNKYKDDLSGKKPYPDKANANMMNHAIWYATKGFDTPFPGEKSVLTPNQVAAEPQTKAASPADNY